jgi:hypothetical protein
MNLNEQREFLRKNNLEMTLKLDKIIEDAKPKPKTEKRPIIPKRIIIEQDITGTPEYKANKQITDLLLSQTLNDTITNAMNLISGKKSENENKVSKEVEEDFKAMNPVEVGDQKRLYYDVPIPPLPNFTPTPPPTAFKTEADFDRERERLLTALNTATERREIIQEEILLVEDQLNRREYAKPIGFNPSIPTYDPIGRRLELEELAVETDSSGLEFASVNQLLDLRDDIRSKDPTFKTKATGIKTLIKAIMAYEEKIVNEQIEAEKSTFVGKKVVATEASLQSDLLRLKFDLRNVEFQIIAIETDLTALNIEHDAFLREIEEDEMKKNNIENERRLLANDALNTFNRLNQGRVQIQREPQETDAELLARIARLGTIQADPSDIENQILEKAKKNILQLTSDTTKAEMTLKSLSSDEQHMMNKIFPKIKKNFIETFGSNNKDLTENDISQFIKTEITNHPFKPAAAPAAPAPAPPEAAEALLPAEEGLVAIGGGISHRALPSSFVFGRIKIDLNKLFYRNILSITDRKGKKMNGIMNKNVSDNFVEIIFKILENKNITKTDLKNIHSERMLYDNLIVQSGIHKSKQIPTTIEDTAPEMKNRLGLITGEIEAGNSNVALLKELHELVFKMAQINLISRSAATNYYNNIKNNYFSHVN